MRAFGINYEITAVAFQRGFHGKQQLIDDVINAQIYINANPLAQFAFAVHAQPFFNNIVSVSVAIACLQS